MGAFIADRLRPRGGSTGSGAGQANRISGAGHSLLDCLFGEAEGGLDEGSETGVGMAPAETIVLCVKAVASMGPDELESFERRTFAAWDRASLCDLRRAIERRRKELAA